MIAFRILAAGALAFGVAAPSLAQDSPAEAAHEAREAHMHLNAYFIGPMAAMAKGEAEFDAEKAASLAGNIAALARLEKSTYWVEGSDSMSLDDSRALPLIWDNLDDVNARFEALAEAADATQAATAEGPEAFAAALGDLGKTCGGCHEKYREPE